MVLCSSDVPLFSPAAGGGAGAAGFAAGTGAGWATACATGAFGCAGGIVFISQYRDAKTIRNEIPIAATIRSCKEESSFAIGNGVAHPVAPAPQAVRRASAGRGPFCP